ncbi:MAG: hypothetical protein WD100_09445 [Tistlia sp.]|uniref:hypothetical protein n=1 Tax=Tistlia sp. TaxID=3057121 RepID=UPI0034A45555
MPIADLLTLLCAGVFALTHLQIHRLGFLERDARHAWLSFSGGVAVAYVFLHVLPELGSHQEVFAEALGLPEETAEAWVYSLALVGLATFYGLERLAKASRARSREQRGEDRVEGELFWLHLGPFGLYNLLIGYLLLHREEPGLWSLAIYFVAMALHFVTTDLGLREHHKERYERRGRWLLAGAVLGGWALGLAVALPPLAIGGLFAFLAGGVVLNVLKEELPEERGTRFWPFGLGTLLYGALLLAG